MEDPSNASTTAEKRTHRCTPKSASEGVVERVRRGECAVKVVVLLFLSSKVVGLGWGNNLKPTLRVSSF